MVKDSVYDVSPASFSWNQEWIDRIKKTEEYSIVHDSIKKRKTEIGNIISSKASTNLPWDLWYNCLETLEGRLLSTTVTGELSNIYSELDELITEIQDELHS